MKYQTIDDLISSLDSSDYDIESLLIDFENDNFEIGDDIEEYRTESIVQRSIDNGQFKQARNQCSTYGLDYSDFV